MSASLQRRRIDVTFTLQPTTSMDGVTTNPTFIEGGNTVTLSGLRVSAAIKKAGGFAMGQLQLRVYGLTTSLMNQLSTLGRLPLAGRNNTVSISAGDDVNGMGVCFQGTITAAWADFKGSPEVPFHVTALAGMSASLAVAPPASYRGSASVVVIMSSLAAQMNLAFENSGVDVHLSNPYFPGTLLAQARACAAAANIEMTIDNNTLIIFPRGGRRGGQIPLISAATGMVGYPAYTQNGIAVTTVYNPSINYGALVKVESSLLPATGEWRVYTLVHDLEAEMPGGAWFTMMEASQPSQAPVR